MIKSRLLLKAVAVLVVGVFAASGTTPAEAATTVPEGCTFCMDVCPTEAGGQLGCIWGCASNYNTCHTGECGLNQAKWHCTTYDM